MARFEIWLDTDLRELPALHTLPDDTFAADNEATQIGVRVTDRGEDVALPGTAVGYVLRPDGETITVPGSKAGNKAVIVLPAAAYAQPGQVTVIIKIEDGEAVTTIGACRCAMHRTATDIIAG